MEETERRAQYAAEMEVKRERSEAILRDRETTIQKVYTRVAKVFLGLIITLASSPVPFPGFQHCMLKSALLHAELTSWESGPGDEATVSQELAYRKITCYRMTSYVSCLQCRVL